MKSKLIFLGLFTLLLAACTQEQVGNYVFEKTLQSGLIEECNKKPDAKACNKLVQQQIKGCLKKSGNFAEFDKNKNPQKMIKFVKTFYPCFKDKEGKALF